MCSDGGEQTRLAMLAQITDRGDVIGGEVDLGRDFGSRVTPIPAIAKVTQQPEEPLKSPALRARTGKRTPFCINHG
jgi:hypothetical protein